MLPNLIGKFELINSEITNYKNIKKIKEKLEDEEVGSVKEVMITYDDRLTRYSLRVKGRGDGVIFQAEKMEIIYDCVGPITAETLASKEFVAETISEIKESFLVWMKKDLKKIE